LAPSLAGIWLAEIWLRRLALDVIAGCNVPSGIAVQIFCNRSLDSSGNIWPNDIRATGRCRERRGPAQQKKRAGEPRRRTPLTIGTDMRADTPRNGMPCK
jgi:hypothetical protein